MENDPVIIKLVNNILDLCNPIKIILFSQKKNLEGKLASFKLCVIVNDDVNVTQLETKLYLELDCDNPFDVLIYRDSEWKEVYNDEGSFASKISRTGAVLYEI